jgi:hypothetical protein
MEQGERILAQFFFATIMGAVIGVIGYRLVAGDWGYGWLLGAVVGFAIELVRGQLRRGQKD